MVSARRCRRRQVDSGVAVWVTVAGPGRAARTGRRSSRPRAPLPGRGRSRAAPRRCGRSTPRRSGGSSTPRAPGSPRPRRTTTSWTGIASGHCLLRQIRSCPETIFIVTVSGETCQVQASVIAGLQVQHDRDVASRRSGAAMLGGDVDVVVGSRARSGPGAPASASASGVGVGVGVTVWCALPPWPLPPLPPLPPFLVGLVGGHGRGRAGQGGRAGLLGLCRPTSRRCRG